MSNVLKGLRASLDRVKAAAQRGGASTDDIIQVEMAIGDLLRQIRSYGPAHARYGKQIAALMNKKSRITAAERTRASEMNQRLMKTHPVKTRRYAAAAEEMDITADRMRSILEGRRPSKKK